MPRHNWGELLAVRIEQGATDCPPHIEQALREAQIGGDVSEAAVARYRKRRRALCADCNQRAVRWCKCNHPNPGNLIAAS